MNTDADVGVLKRAEGPRVESGGAPPAVRNPLRWFVFAVVIAANVMDLMDATIVNVATATTLAEHGDLSLALEILAPGLLRHPDSRELAELRQRVLVRLMEQRQWSDPFGFLFYADMAGAELSPVG